MPFIFCIILNVYCFRTFDKIQKYDSGIAQNRTRYTRKDASDNSQDYKDCADKKDYYSVYGGLMKCCYLTSSEDTISISLRLFFMMSIRFNPFNLPASPFSSLSPPTHILSPFT